MCNEKLYSLISIALILSTFILSCEEKTGGPCTYNYIPGEAEFTDIVIDDHALNIQIIFTPDNPNARNSYQFPNFSDTNFISFVCHTLLPKDSAWLDDKGLTIGSTYRCIRREIITGTCTPYAFELTDIDCSGT